MNGVNVYREPEENHGGPARTEAAKISTLTEIERDIITLVCYGFKDRQVALSANTTELMVRRHLASIYDKLGVSGRLDLVLYAFAHGLAPLSG